MLDLNCIEVKVLKVEFMLVQLLHKITELPKLPVVLHVTMASILNDVP